MSVSRTVRMFISKAFLGSPGSLSRIEGTGHWRHQGCQRCEEWWGGGVCFAVANMGSPLKMSEPLWKLMFKSLYQLYLAFGFVPPGLVVACLPDQFAPKQFSSPLLVKTNSHIYWMEQFYYDVRVYVPNCAYSLLTYTYFTNTGRDVLVSQIIQQPKPKRIRLEQFISRFRINCQSCSRKCSLSWDRKYQISLVDLIPRCNRRHRWNHWIWGSGSRVLPRRPKWRQKRVKKKVQPAVKDVFVWVILSAYGMDVVSHRCCCWLCWCCWHCCRYLACASKHAKMHVFERGYSHAMLIWFGFMTHLRTYLWFLFMVLP